jgi:hypothetical protein
MKSKTTFAEMENTAWKLGLQINQERTKYDSGKKNTLKQNKTGQLKIKKNYKFERAENFKYLEVILNEDNNHQIHLQDRIKMLTKYTLCYKFFSNIKTYPKTKIDTKGHSNRQNVNIYASETSTLTATNTN